MRSDDLVQLKWRPSIVPKPTLTKSTHSIDMRGLRKMNSDPYLEYLVKREGENYLDLRSLFNVLPMYEELVLSMEKFVIKHGADFDKDILHNTAALSLLPPCHTFLDEFGCFTLTQKSKIEICDPSIYLSHYETKIDDIRKVSASYPRGKNTGLPIIVSGGNRFTSNVVNVINLISASTFQTWMYEMSYDQFIQSMDDVIKWLNQQFGYATSQVVFSRFQHIGKKVKVTFTDTKGEWFDSTNLFPRRRIVNSTIKYIAMALKAAVKVLTEIDLNTPAFQQDRTLIEQRIAECYRKGGVVLAMDQSRFDLRHGGDKNVHLYEKVMGPRFERVFGRVGKQLIFLSKIESSSETLIPTLDGVYAGSGLEVLKSGESATSRKGSWMNLCDDMTITREAMNFNDKSVNEYYLKHQPSAILGDDLLKMFPTPSDAERYERAMLDISISMGVSVELEKPTKFLGALILNAHDKLGASPNLDTYHGRKINTPEWVQPMGSIVQKAVFPERFRSEMYPTFAAIIKFVVLPFLAIQPSQIRSNTYITPEYLKDVKQLLAECGSIRKKYLNKRSEYFDKSAINFPTDRNAADDLYEDLLKDPSKYGLDVAYDFDEILNALYKGLEFDLNWAVVGLDPTEEEIVKGKLKDVTSNLIDEISPDAKASEFIVKLIREVNASYKPDSTFIKFMYDTVIRNHKLLGLRYSPGLPIY